MRLLLSALPTGREVEDRVRREDSPRHSVRLVNRTGPGYEPASSKIKLGGIDIPLRVRFNLVPHAICVIISSLRMDITFLHPTL